MSKAWKLVLSALFFQPTNLQAVEIRHSIQPLDSPYSLQTQGLCYSIMEEKNNIRCMPWANAIIKAGSISVIALAKANEEGMRIYQRVEDKQIDQPFLDKIFREDNFQDASGFIQAQAIFRNLVISIMPLHVMAGFKLNNPSLPEIHLAEQTQALILIGGSWLLPIAGLEDSGEILIAPMVYHYDRTTMAGDFDALDSATTPYRDLVHSWREKGEDADLALGWSSKLWFIPSLILRGFYLLPPKPCSECRTSYLNIEQAQQRSSSAAVAWTVDHGIGQSLFGFTLTFDEIFKDFDSDRSALAYMYRISRLKSFLSYSAIKTSFGFLFDAGLYQVGIQYTREEQVPDLLVDRVNQTYVFTSLVL